MRELEQALTSFFLYKWRKSGLYRGAAKIGAKIIGTLKKRSGVAHVVVEEAVAGYFYDLLLTSRKYQQARMLLSGAISAAMSRINRGRLKYQ